MNFILRDNKNKRYQTFWGVTKEREQQVAQNVKTIYSKTQQHLIINYVLPSFDPEEHLGLGWSIDQELYEQLVHDFNNLKPEEAISL